MKYNRDFAIKGALVVAILIVIGVSAHLYSKKKREPFDVDMNSLTAFYKGALGVAGATGADGVAGADGEDGTDGASAFNIAKAEKRWTGAADTKSGWINSLKGAPGLTGAAGKNWDNASVWTSEGVTAAAGSDKVAVADIVKHIIAEVKTEMPISEPLGTIRAYHIGHNPALKTMLQIKQYVNSLGWVVCDGQPQFDANLAVLGSGVPPPDLRGRFLYQQRDISTKSTAYPNNDGMGLSVDAFSGDKIKQDTLGQLPEGKVIIKSNQIASHTHTARTVRKRLHAQIQTNTTDPGRGSLMSARALPYRSSRM